jgi:hypothetical protein
METEEEEEEGPRGTVVGTSILTRRPRSVGSRQEAAAAGEEEEEAEEAEAEAAEGEKE